MPPETEKLPFWHRPIPMPRLPKEFWRYFWIAVGAGLVLLVLSPWIYGWVEWRMHPAVIYRGVTFSMPRGWIRKDGSWDVEVERPGSMLFKSPVFGASNLSIRRNDLLVRTAQQESASFELMEKIINPTGKFVEFMATDPQQQPVRIRCGIDVISVNCISMDGKWSFLFMGYTNDLRDAFKIMQTFVASDVSTPAHKSAPPQ